MVPRKRPRTGSRETKVERKRKAEQANTAIDFMEKKKELLEKREEILNERTKVLEQEYEMTHNVLSMPLKERTEDQAKEEGKKTKEGQRCCPQ